MAVFSKNLGVAVRNDPSDDNFRLLAFGQNHSSQLGIGSQNIPLQVSSAGTGYVKVVAGSNHGSLFIKSDGFWGAGSYLGGDDPNRDLGPRQLDAGPVTSYSTGGYQSETMLSGPARTDRFGPSVLVITADSETVMLTSTHLTTLNNSFHGCFSRGRRILS